MPKQIHIKYYIYCLKSFHANALKITLALSHKKR